MRPGPKSSSKWTGSAACEGRIAALAPVLLPVVAAADQPAGPAREIPVEGAPERLHAGLLEAASSQIPSQLTMCMSRDLQDAKEVGAAC